MTPATGLMAVAMTGGVAVFVPATLGAITTYVLLEQEDWFEPEIQFVRKLVTPGMRALDIGANYGVYATTLAALTGSAGRVFAFEPARSVAAALRRSAIHNRLPWLQVVGLALSDRNGVAVLGGGTSPGRGARHQPAGLRPRRALPRPQPAFRAADPGTHRGGPVAGQRHHRDAGEGGDHL